jgi:hypothetical protein
MLERKALARGECRRRHEHSQGQQSAQPAQDVTLEGSGLLRSMREYQGIARKNAKYTIVPMTDIVWNG